MSPPTESSTVLCQAREDADHDGKISVMWGHHGDALGDQLRTFLIVDSGPGAPFDEMLAADASARFPARRAPAVPGRQTQGRSPGGADPGDRGEVELDPGAGTLWRAHLDPRGRWVAADMIADRQWPWGAPDRRPIVPFGEGEPVVAWPPSAAPRANGGEPS